MKNKKILFFLLILGISIGFAYLSTNLNITGSSLIKGNSWDVHFENVQVTSGSVTATTPTITNNAHQVNYTVTLNMPGDYFEFTVDAVNDGTIDAMVDTVSNTGLTEDQLKYLDYTVKLANDEPLNHGYILLNQTTKTYKVRLEYKLDISEDDLPDSDQTISLTFTVNYQQTDEDAYTTSTFKTGTEVSSIMKDIGGDNSDEDWYVESEIISFEHASMLPDSSVSLNIASTEESDTPIYIWSQESDEKIYDGSDINGYIIYWYSEADVVYLNEDSSFLFSDPEIETYEFKYLKNISGLTNIDTKKVKNMEYMFLQCRNLKDYSAIENWNVSNVENMCALFMSSGITEAIYLSSWNTSKVNDFWAFFGYCEDLTTTVGLESFEFSNTTSISHFFSGCSSLSDLSGLSNWNLNSIIYFENLFEECSSITTLNSISNWDLSNAKFTNNMFEKCTSLININSINNWNVSEVKNMEYMFYNTGVSTLSALSDWNIGNVKKMSFMFCECNNLTDASGINNWSTKLNANLDYSNMFSSVTTTKPSWYV